MTVHCVADICARRPAIFASGKEIEPFQEGTSAAATNLDLDASEDSMTAFRVAADNSDEAKWRRVSTGVATETVGNCRLLVMPSSAITWARIMEETSEPQLTDLSVRCDHV